MKIKLLLAALFLSLGLSATAEAGNWGTSSIILTMQVTSLYNLSAMAGTPFTVPAITVCSVPSVYTYYEAYGWLCRAGTCRGFMRVLKQNCI